MKRSNAEVKSVADEQEVKVRVDDRTWLTPSTAKFVWYRGELRESGLAGVRELTLEPDVSVVPASVEGASTEPTSCVVARCRLTSQLRGLFGPTASWSGELMYGDPFDATREARLWVGWEDSGLAISAVLEVAYEGRLQALHAIPGNRLRSASEQQLRKELLGGFGAGELAVSAAIEEKASAVPRSWAFSVPMEPRSEPQAKGHLPQDLVEALELALVRAVLMAAADRDALQPCARAGGAGCGRR